jgi:hypothetical protein
MAKRWTEADVDLASEAAVGKIVDRLYSSGLAWRYGHDYSTP